MAYFINPSLYVSPNKGGAGYIAGTSPNGLVLNAGAPVARTVLALDEALGLIVGRTVSSAVDGTYLIPMMDPNRTFKVICVGQNGDNDLIWAGVHPRPY